MRTRKVDNAIERHIATGAIVSDRYVKELAVLYQPDLMAVPFAKTVVQWCLDFYTQYEKAPGRHIQDIFDSHRRNGLPEEQSNLIEDFLADISEEHERAEVFNVDYLLDQTETRFELRNQALLAADIQALHLKGDHKAAEECILNYKKVQRPSGSGVEPLIDEGLIQRSLEKEDGDVLIKLPGALGEFLKPVVRRDFIGILGHEKVGKSYRMLDLAMRGLRAKCNVAYFDAGDSTEEDITVRLHMRNTRCSVTRQGRMLSPIMDCYHSQDDSCNKRERKSREGVLTDVNVNGKIVRKHIPYEQAAGYVPCTECMHDNRWDFKGAVWYEEIDVERLTVQRAMDAGKKTARQTNKRFKLSCHPNGTLSVSAAEAILDMWEAVEGFIPDLIFFDYPDIMIADNPKITDERQRHNEIWKAGRRLSQRRHCAVFFATQADAASYDTRTLRAKNFSEDKRKYAHVTKFWTLNQTEEEKADMVMRIGAMFYRNARVDESRTVTILQNLDIGQPYLGSFF